jgi:prevent-host-death family protein
MQTQPGTRVPLTEFRNDLTEILDRLDETGPVRVMRHGAPIAEIRSATPEGDRRYAKAVLNAFGYLEGLDAGLTGLLAQLGVDTLEALVELATRHKVFTDSGVTFDRYPGHALPEGGPLTVDEALAHLYFGDDYPGSVAGGGYEWFRICAKLQEEAVKRGLGSILPQPNAYDESQPTFVELAVSSGHTPQSLLQFGVSSLDQGVPLTKLADLLGEAAVPADVAAMKEYDDYWFTALTGAGLPHGEAVAFFRAGLGDRVKDGITLVSAGITTAEEVKELLDAGISLPLVTRARQDGLAPEEWRAQVPVIQHLKYEGEGNLPFRLLVEAAREKVSLVRWDKSSLPVKDENSRRSFHATSKERQVMYPWVHAYPDRVLDLARAGISPSYLAAFGRLMENYYKQPETSEDFADLAIRVHELGLTGDMANAMTAGRESKRVRLTPEQLIAVLEEGLTDAGTAHYLANRYLKPAEWLEYLRQRKDRQLMTDTFIATVENTPTWGVVRAAVQEMQRLIKARHLGGSTPYLKGVVEKFLSGGVLNDHEVLTLLVKVAYAFGDLSYLSRAWREEHADFAEPVRQLAKNFGEMCGGQTAVE